MTPTVRDDVSMPNQPKTPQRTIRVDDALWAAARAIAAERGETLSDVLRAALEVYVNDPKSRPAR